MTEISERDRLHSSPLAGLVPTRLREASAESAASNASHRAYSRETSRLAKSLFSTMPVVLVGSLAIASMNMTGPIDTSALKRPNHPGSDTANLGASLRDAYAARNAKTATAEVAPIGDLSTASAPSTYAVRGGDTVSSIAGRYGLATASVLALNGLSWKSLIFPGQVLKLTQGAPARSTTPAAATTTTTASVGASKYTIVAGDTLTRIASKFGVSLQTLLSVNGLGMSSIIYAGHTLTIPGTTTVASVPVSKPATSAPVVTAPVVSAPVVVTPTAPVSNGAYKIASGDTITSIAKKLGVTIQALLAANGLTAASIIYAGRTLVVPGAASAPVTQVAQVGTTVTPLSPTMKANALTIIAVGKQRGVPEYGIIVALAAAAQESGLQNLAYGDLDSVGLFQQRPSSGWGSVAQLENTTYAAQLFYGGPSNPNRGITRGLLDIPGWQSMTVTQAAQAVQISAYPTAYAKWETSARAWYAALA